MTVVIAMMSRIYWRIVWMIWVIRRIIWVISTPSPIWIPCVAPIIWVIAPIRSVCRIPEWIPEWVPVAKTEAYSEVDGYTGLGRSCFDNIYSVDYVLDDIDSGIILVNCCCFGVVFTPFGVNCAGVEIAVI